MTDLSGARLEQLMKEYNDIAQQNNIMRGRLNELEMEFDSATRRSACNPRDRVLATQVRSIQRDRNNIIALMQKNEQRLASLSAKIQQENAKLGMAQQRVAMKQQRAMVQQQRAAVKQQMQAMRSMTRRGY